MPGVDVFGGMAEIKQNLQSNVYSTQFAFEKDLFSLLNILPHEGHLSYALPLFSTFQIGPAQASLISVSKDGTSLPELYLSADAQYSLSGSYEPSPVDTINGLAAADYVQEISLSTANSPQDPDAMYNRMFFSKPRISLGQFASGSWATGLHATDNTTIVFRNGSSVIIDNVAFAALDFAENDIRNGSALHETIEVPSNNRNLVRRHERQDVLEEEHLYRMAKRDLQSLSDDAGYPSSPIVFHSSGGYVAGYFLSGSTDVAVLSVRGFQSRLEDTDRLEDNAEMQNLVARFFRACTQTGRSKLIIDLQGNGGGSVFNGFDLFKQLFPSIEPFGGSRFRATPAVDFMGQAFTTFGEYDTSFSTSYQTQAQVDEAGEDFPSWSAMFGPESIYGDEFTPILRYNLSDPVSTFFGNGIWISGYGSLRSSANNQAPFTSENIVLLQDGLCASTCAIFSEMMISQGKVRSVAMGGRPFHGPMQGVGGTKGAQVQSFALLQAYANVSVLLESPPSDANLPSLDAPPMYPVLGTDSPTLNWRNNYSPDDTTTPLQFKYEAANCRLFFRAQDVFNMTELWLQVANAAWGTQTCVQGSSPAGNGGMPGTAAETVGYDARWLSNTSAPAGPGSIGNATVNGLTTPSGTGSAPAASSSKSGSVRSVKMKCFTAWVGACIACAGIIVW